MRLLSTLARRVGLRLHIVWLRWRLKRVSERVRHLQRQIPGACT